MSNTTKAILALGLVAFFAACAQQEEPAPVVEETMVVEEPAMGKM